MCPQNQHSFKIQWSKPYPGLMTSGIQSKPMWTSFSLIFSWEATALASVTTLPSPPPSLEQVSQIISPSHQHFNMQFSSVVQSCPTLCNPMNCSIQGLPVHHQFLESTQTHVHQVGDAIQPSNPLLSPSLPALNLSQHQGLFQWVSHPTQQKKNLDLWAPGCVRTQKMQKSLSYFLRAECDFLVFWKRRLV